MTYKKKFVTKKCSQMKVSWREVFNMAWTYGKTFIGSHNIQKSSRANRFTDSLIFFCNRHSQNLLLSLKNSNISYDIHITFNYHMLFFMKFQDWCAFLWLELMIPKLWFLCLHQTINVMLFENKKNLNFWVTGSVESWNEESIEFFPFSKNILPILAIQTHFWNSWNFTIISFIEFQYILKNIEHKLFR